MVKELKGQESFYTITPEEKLSRIQKCSENVEQRLRTLLEARAAYVQGKEDYRKAQLELNGELGTAGLQEKIEGELKKAKEADGGPGFADTLEKIVTTRRNDTEFKALRYLAAVGTVSNMDLALVVKVDPHGLAGVLSKCDKVEKVHDGNLNNERMLWRLKPGVVIK